MYRIHYSTSKTENQVRICDRDFLAIQNRAERARLSMTAFITSTALGRPIVVIDGLNGFLRR